MHTANPFVTDLLVSLDRYLFGKCGDTKEWFTLYRKSLARPKANALSVDISFLLDCVKCEWISWADYTRYVTASMFFRNPERNIVKISAGRHCMVPNYFMCEGEIMIMDNRRLLIVQRKDYQMFRINFLNEAA